MNFIIRLSRITEERKTIRIWAHNKDEAINIAKNISDFNGSENLEPGMHDDYNVDYHVLSVKEN